MFFGDSQQNNFWFLKISQTSKWVGKKTSSTPERKNMETKNWWFGNVSPSPRGIFRFHVSQQFFGTIFSVWQDPGSPLHLGTPSSKSTRPTSQQVGLQKSWKLEKMHLGVPKGTYAVHIQDIRSMHVSSIPDGHRWAPAKKPERPFELEPIEGYGPIPSFDRIPGMILKSLLKSDLLVAIIFSKKKLKAEKEDGEWGDSRCTRHTHHREFPGVWYLCDAEQSPRCLWLLEHHELGKQGLGERWFFVSVFFDEVRFLLGGVGVAFFMILRMFLWTFEEVWSNPNQIRSNGFRSQ